MLWINIYSENFYKGFGGNLNFPGSPLFLCSPLQIIHKILSGKSNFPGLIHPQNIEHLAETNKL
jgi:hypothetical protein